MTALGLALAGALSWAVGNVLGEAGAGRSRHVPAGDLAQLVPPVPALLVSGVLDQQGVPLLEAVRRASWLGIGAAVYLGALATPSWPGLRRRATCSSATRRPVVAPFALLAPCTGSWRRR